ncbi:P-type conjugative transfer protein TrbL [Alloalcanivorax xenomutans]|uniref:P-type conjugative transfer protein TrbL n=1 Tax=Alloalcanivorax xenomutans TaxID=1094342 RepID=UPI003A80603D
MHRALLTVGAVALLSFVSQDATAAVQPDGLLDEVAQRFGQSASGWAGIISDAASRLFWTLVAISMGITFGFMILQKADIGDFFAEFVRFTIFVGFFWWLLMNGPRFAMDIIDSLRTLSSQASGMSRELTPSTPISIGWDVVVKAAKNYSAFNPIDNLSILLISAAILVCMAIVAANVMLTLVSAWIIAYTGIFVLGFGGSRWTSEIAINYFRNVLAMALKLMTITLMVGIGIDLMDSYYQQLSEGAPVRELLLVFVVAIVLTFLISSVPNVVAGLVPGGGGGAGVGSFGAGAVVGAAATAGAAIATGGAAVAGGAEAVKAAASKASQNISSGNDVLGGMLGARKVVLPVQQQRWLDMGPIRCPIWPKALGALPGTAPPPGSVRPRVVGSRQKSGAMIQRRQLAIMGLATREAPEVLAMTPLYSTTIACRPHTTPISASTQHPKSLSS